MLLYIFLYLSQFRKVVLTAEGALPHILFSLSLRCCLVQLITLRTFVCESRYPGLYQLANVECLRCFFGHHVENFFSCRWPEGFPQILIHMMQFKANVLNEQENMISGVMWQNTRNVLTSLVLFNVKKNYEKKYLKKYSLRVATTTYLKCNVLLAESLPLQFFRERIKIKFGKFFRLLKNFFESISRISFFFVIFESVDCHFAGPLVGFVVDARSVEHFNVNLKEDI